MTMYDDMQRANAARRELKRRMLITKWHDIDLHAELQETRHNWQAEADELRDQIEQLESALVDVKYWMHAAQFRRSWPLLRKVEDALGS